MNAPPRRPQKNVHFTDICNAAPPQNRLRFEKASIWMVLIFSYTSFTLTDAMNESGFWVLEPSAIMHLSNINQYASMNNHCYEEYTPAALQFFKNFRINISPSPSHIRQASANQRKQGANSITSVTQFCTRFLIITLSCICAPSIVVLTKLSEKQLLDHLVHSSVENLCVLP